MKSSQSNKNIAVVIPSSSWQCLGHLNRITQPQKESKLLCLFKQSRQTSFFLEKLHWDSSIWKSARVSQYKYCCLLSYLFDALSIIFCERHKTTQRTLFLLFANNNWFPITLLCLAATRFSNSKLNWNIGIVHPPRYLRWRENLISLKVVGNEKVGGSGMCQTVPICLGPRRRGSFLSKFCRRLWFYVFPFPPQ